MYCSTNWTRFQSNVVGISLDTTYEQITSCVVDYIVTVFEQLLEFFA